MWRTPISSDGLWTPTLPVGCIVNRRRHVNPRRRLERFPYADGRYSAFHGRGLSIRWGRRGSGTPIAWVAIGRYDRVSNSQIETPDARSSCGQWKTQE